MKHTQKYLAGLETAGKIGLVTGRKIENAELFDMLQLRGWFWVDGEWTDQRPQTSIFESGGQDALPTGVYRLRIMAHPDDVDKVVKLLGRHLKITDVSDPYPNRKGPGVRVYVEGKL